jgi:hypothetical protein
MNDYHLVQENISLTKNWTIHDWKKFRSKYNYWNTRDRLMKNKDYHSFKRFKNNCLRNYK